MRVPLSFRTSVEKLDPANIINAFEYELCRNLYGRLVAHDSDGQLVADVADSFSVTNHEVTFSFGNKVTTFDGHLIDALDAEASLKRLVFRGKSGHGDIRRFLCPNFILQNFSDECPSIRVEGSKLILKVVDESYLPFLISTLESADFSILPRHLFDLNNGDLNVRGHKETSGPYYVESDSADGAIKLRANERHYRFHKKMPQVVEVEPTVGTEAMKRFECGELDYLPSTFYFSGDIAKNLLNDSKYHRHETVPLRLLLVKFSPGALAWSTPEQRFYIGTRVGQAFAKHFGSAGAHSTSQFFQSLSEGALNDDQLAEIEALRSRTDPINFGRPMTFAAIPSQFDALSAELAGVPGLRVIKSEKAAVYLPPDERPDIYIASTDSALTEDMSLIGYNFEVGSFEVPGLDKEKWFADYLLTKEKSDRVKKLNRLHFDVLRNASIVPVEIAPYYSLAQKGWTLNQSKFSPGTELWLIRQS